MEMGLGPPALRRKRHRPEPDGLGAYALRADPRCVVESLLAMVALPRSHHAPKACPCRLSHSHSSKPYSGNPSWVASIVTMTPTYKVVKFATHATGVAFEFPRMRFAGNSSRCIKPAATEGHDYYRSIPAPILGRVLPS